MNIEISTNFAFGELSPNLQGFTNIESFKRGLLKQQNFLNMMTGGIRFREGTYYAADTYQDTQSKLIPFVFNNQQAYALEFNSGVNGVLRFYTNGGQLQVSFAITNATWAANQATFTLTAFNSGPWYVGDTIVVSGMNPAGYNGTYQIVSQTATTVTVALNVNPGAFVSGGTLQGPYQLGTVYGNGAPVSWTQIDDILYLADGVHPIQQLQRLGATNWTIGAVAFVNGPWSTVQNGTQTTLSIAGSTITASANTFAATDVGRLILWLDVNDSFNGSVGAWKWATITAYTSATQVTVGAWAMGTGTNNNCKPPTNPVGPYTVTAASWANTNNGQATYTIGAHSLLVGSIVDITGVNPGQYNVTSASVIAVTGTTFTIAMINNPGAYVGGGSVKISNANFWALGAWSATTGYPSLVAMHQQRLVAGSTTLKPQTIWSSVIGTYTDMTPFDPDGTVNPDQSYSYELAAGRADAIKWMEADQYLIMGTGYGEYIGSSAGPTITPSDINAQKQTNLGASTVGLRPVLLNYRAIIPQRGNQFLYDWRYNWQYARCIGQRMNSFADHILRPNVSFMDFAQVPIETVWILRSDGILVAATETGEQWAFSRQVLGGAFGAGSPVVESICVIPATSPSNYDQVWMAVKRTVNGATVRFIEYLTQPFWPSAGVGSAMLTNAFFVDAGLTYNGAPTNTFTGFGYLQGQTVAILADGVPQANQVVPGNGTITLGAAHSVVTIGLPYSGFAQTMPIAKAEVQGRLTVANVAYARLQDTQGGLCAGMDGNYVQIPEAQAGAPGVLDPGSGTNGLFSGFSHTIIGGGWNRGATITYQQNSPLPMKILNIVVDYESGTA